VLPAGRAEVLPYAAACTPSAGIDSLETLFCRSGRMWMRASALRIDMCNFPGGHHEYAQAILSVECIAGRLISGFGLRCRPLRRSHTVSQKFREVPNAPRQKGLALYRRRGVSAVGGWWLGEAGKQPGSFADAGLPVFGNYSPPLRRYDSGVAR
jgi:hypothetical protein